MEVASIATIHLWLSSITVATAFAIAFDELIVGLAHHPMSLHYHILLPLHLPYHVAVAIVHPCFAINLYLYLIFSLGLLVFYTSAQCNGRGKCFEHGP